MSATATVHANRGKETFTLPSVFCRFTDCGNFSSWELQEESATGEDTCRSLCKLGVF